MRVPDADKTGPARLRPMRAGLALLAIGSTALTGIAVLSGQGGGSPAPVVQAPVDANPITGSFVQVADLSAGISATRDLTTDAACLAPVPVGLNSGDDDPAALIAYHRDLVRDCPLATARMPVLGQAIDALSMTAASMLLELERQYAVGSEDDVEHLAVLGQHLAVRRFADAFADGRLRAAGTAAMTAAQPGPAIRLGYAALERGDTGTARRWFERALDWGAAEDAYLGTTAIALKRGNLDQARLVLAQLDGQSPRVVALQGQVTLLAAQAEIESGNIETALALIDEVAEVADRLGNDGLKGQVQDQKAIIRLSEVQKAFEAGDYARARDMDDALAEEQRKSDADIHDAAMKIAAWSRYHLNEYRAAASRFEQLLDSKDAVENAEGLALSLAADDEFEELIGIAANQSGEVARTLRIVGRDQALARDHVQTASLVAGKGLEAIGLHGIGDPWMQAGVAVRYTDGEPGQDRFLSAAPTLALGVPIGRHRVAGIVRAPIIDTETPRPGDLVGTPTPVGAMGRFDPTDDLYAMEPSFSWTYEAQIQPFAQLGTTPLTGEVSPLPTGEVGVIYHGKSGWRASASLAASARRDSLLSLAGIDDPVTGDAYGRVVEAGPRVQAVVPLGERWTVSGEALASTFIGENIVENDRLGIGAGISYDLDLGGFEHFGIGPSYRYETYSENEFFFTYGHGGYFSPQEFHRVSLDMNFQTTEYKDFLFRGTASIGYETFDEASSPILPENPGFGSFAASNSKALALSGLVEGAYLISPRWQLIGFAGGASASDYTEYVAGLSLRYTFGERDGLVVRDLFPAELGFSQR